MKLTEESENRIAAVALGRTVAFAIYSVLVIPIAAVLSTIGPWRQADGDPRPSVFLAVVTVLLVALFVGVAKGVMPGTRGATARAFDERQLALGCTAASLVVLVLPLDPAQHQALDVVLNGGLLVGVLVYFITKSTLSHRPRWLVLVVGVLPALQLFM